ncbi:hypothetical protein Tco_0621506 [Tanacetum coccineum]
MILGRPFLDTIHARIDVFDKEISLGVGEDKIVFDMNGYVHHPIVLVENACMINEVQEDESFNPLEIGNDLFSYESPLCLEFEKHNYLCLTMQNKDATFISDDIQEDCEREKGMRKMVEPETTTPRLHYYRRLHVLRDGEFEFWPTCDPNYFEEELETNKDPFSRSLDEYKLAFDMEIEQLADEYELGIGKKGYVLDDI